ncbi:MAG: hypothetical protein ACXWCG_01275 [Flavitalea sp.]
MNKYYILVLCLFIVQLNSCTKEDTIVIDKNRELLVNKKWKITFMSIQTNNGLLTNTYDSLPSFRRDDYFLFKRDSTYELNDHIDTMQGKNSKILDAGVWKINNTRAYMEMQSDLYNTTYTPARIVESTATKLTLERIHPGDSSVTVTSYIPL